MQRFWFLVYNLLIVPALWVLFHLVALFNPKVRLGIRERKGLFEKLEMEVEPLNGRHRLWFHASSLGEFESAKPLIAALRDCYSSLNIIVSFFSPSGYQHSKNYRLADIITYLPFDSRKNAQRFIDFVQPTAAIFVRYDVWPNYLWALRRRCIPSLIANATMRDRSSRRLPILQSFHRSMYNNLDAILAVSEADAQAYRRLHLTSPRLEVVGDTRYDQVWAKSQEVRSKRFIPKSILRGKKVLVVGSSWEGDERIILPAFSKMLSEHPNLLLIIVPHEPDEENLDRIENELDRFRANRRGLYIRFTDLNNYRSEHVIIVDSVGILLTLYSYATVAYVGGGFLGKPGGGVHNVLEPAVYGIPVLYGPNHENSQEAVALCRLGGGFVVNDEDDLSTLLARFFRDEKARVEAGKRCREFVLKNTGATQRVIKYLEPYLK